MTRTTQVVLAGASEYERKSQRVDFAALSELRDVRVIDPAALRTVDRAIVHVYGPSPLPAAELAGLTAPFVANAAVARRRFALRKSPQPAFVVSPLGPPHELLPEAVEEKWFLYEERRRGSGALHRIHVIGTFGPHRTGVRNMIAQTAARLHRFRDDLEWKLFDDPPTPDDLSDVDVWVDPASAESDFDGFVAEACVAGKPLVASRTPINIQRLERGRTGFLVPAGDPNELGHAILTALFKPEVARLKIQAAKQTAGKFRPRQRLRVLERIYETLTE